MFVFGLLILVLGVIPLFLLLVFVPIHGVMQGDLFVALLGPGYLLFYFSLGYLLSGHWLRLFRRRNDD